MSPPGTELCDRISVLPGAAPIMDAVCLENRLKKDFGKKLILKARMIVGNGKQVVSGMDMVHFDLIILNSMLIEWLGNLLMVIFQIKCKFSIIVIIENVLILLIFFLGLIWIMYVINSTNIEKILREVKDME